VELGGVFLGVGGGGRHSCWWVGVNGLGFGLRVERVKVRVGEMVRVWSWGGMVGLSGASGIREALRPINDRRDRGWKMTHTDCRPNCLLTLLYPRNGQAACNARS